MHDQCWNNIVLLNWFAFRLEWRLWSKLKKIVDYLIILVLIHVEHNQEDLDIIVLYQDLLV